MSKWWQAKPTEKSHHIGVVTRLANEREDFPRHTIKFLRKILPSLVRPKYGREIADLVNALKAGNTIEATAPRGERKLIAAEEPITARIRRRQEEATEVQHADEENSPAGHAEPGNEPPMTFQERIELERRRKADGEGHSPG